MTKDGSARASLSFYLSAAQSFDYACVVKYCAICYVFMCFPLTCFSSRILFTPHLFTWHSFLDFDSLCEVDFVEYGTKSTDLYFVQ